MATNANPYIVNIVPLQGIVTGLTNTSETATQITAIQANVANLQTMVDYTTGTISADYIKSLTTGNTIQFTNNINLSNTSLYSSDSLVSFNNISSISNNNISTFSSISFSSNSYISIYPSTISFVNAGNDVLKITSTGTLQYISPLSSISTGIDISGFLYVSQDAYVKTLFQSSDRNKKTNIMPFTTYLDRVLELKPYSFNWINTGQADIGFIAQDVKSTWPELTVNETSLAYSRFVPLLLEGMRELRDRISTLEGKDYSKA